MLINEAGNKVTINDVDDFDNVDVNVTIKDIKYNVTPNGYDKKVDFLSKTLDLTFSCSLLQIMDYAISNRKIALQGKERPKSMKWNKEHMHHVLNADEVGKKVEVITVEQQAAKAGQLSRDDQLRLKDELEKLLAQ